tara:strand:- start:108 stop:1298 length:1191 start_codon:yes stop_codon:yes gene_type:complete
MIIAELCNIEYFEKKYFFQQNLYDFLGKKYKKFYFINIYNIFNKRKININYQFYKKKNIYFFNPKTINELNKFLNKNNIFLINNLSFQFKHILFHYLVSKKNIFQISFTNTFQFSNYYVEMWKYVDFIRKIKFLFTKKFSLFLHRALVILRVIDQINTLYISKKDVFEKYNSSNYNKKILIKKYKYIKKTTVKLPFLKKRNNQLEKYITFVDSNIFHNDISKRGHIIDNVMAKKYLLFLKTYLKNLSKVFKKKVIICLHPASNYNLYKKELGKYKLCKYKTDKYILDSFLVLFHDSTSIFSAIIAKKKIISLKSDIFGSYLNARRLFYVKKFNFVEHNIEKNLKIKKKILNEKLIQKVENYQKIIRKLHYGSNNSLPIEKLIDNEIQKFIKKKIKN